MSNPLASHFRFFEIRIRFVPFLAAVAFCSTLCGTTAAQDTPPPSPAKTVPVQWITAPGAPAREVTMLHFRKEIELEKVPEHFLIDVSADNRFLLMVNQQRVGSGPSRGDLAHWRYEVYDLA